LEERRTCEPKGKRFTLANSPLSFLVSPSLFTGCNQFLHETTSHMIAALATLPHIPRAFPRLAYDLRTPQAVKPTHANSYPPSPSLLSPSMALDFLVLYQIHSSTTVRIPPPPPTPVTPLSTPSNRFSRRHAIPDPPHAFFSVRPRFPSPPPPAAYADAPFIVLSLLKGGRGPPTRFTFLFSSVPNILLTIAHDRSTRFSFFFPQLTSTVPQGLACPLLAGKSTPGTFFSRGVGGGGWGGVGWLVWCGGYPFILSVSSVPPESEV